MVDKKHGPKEAKKKDIPADSLDTKWQAFDPALMDEEEAGGGTQGALEHPSYGELEARLTEAEQKVTENWNLVLRTQAEMENIKRRAERQLADAHKYGVAKLIEELIPVMDSLGQGLEMSKGQGAPSQIQEGVQLTLQMITKALQKFGLVELDPEGEVFNPNFHEAMAVQEVPGEEPNRVLKVFQKGYVLHDRLIRPARVIVSK